MKFGEVLEVENGCAVVEAGRDFWDKIGSRL